MKNAMFITDMNYAHITKISGKEIVTCRLFPGKYVKIDDGRNYPQLCIGATERGVTISFENPEQFARDCNATLYTTQKGYEAAKKRIAARLLG